MERYLNDYDKIRKNKKKLSLQHDEKFYRSDFFDKIIEQIKGTEITLNKNPVSIFLNVLQHCTKKIQIH